MNFNKVRIITLLVIIFAVGCKKNLTESSEKFFLEKLNQNVQNEDAGSMLSFTDFKFDIENDSLIIECREHKKFEDRVVCQLVSKVNMKDLNDLSMDGKHSLHFKTNPKSVITREKCSDIDKEIIEHETDLWVEFDIPPEQNLLHELRNALKDLKKGI